MVLLYNRFCFCGQLFSVDFTKFLFIFINVFLKSMQEKLIPCDLKLCLQKQNMFNQGPHRLEKYLNIQDRL